MAAKSALEHCTARTVYHSSVARELLVAGPTTIFILYSASLQTSTGGLRWGVAQWAAVPSLLAVSAAAAGVAAATVLYRPGRCRVVSDPYSFSKPPYSCMSTCSTCVPVLRHTAMVWTVSVHRP